MALPFPLQPYLQLLLLLCLLQQFLFHLAKLKLVYFSLRMLALSKGTHLQKIGLFAFLLQSRHLLRLQLRRLKQKSPQTSHLQKQRLHLHSPLLGQTAPRSHQRINWGTQEWCLVPSAQSAIFLIRGACVVERLLQRGTVVGVWIFWRWDVVKEIVAIALTSASLASSKRFVSCEIHFNRKLYYY